MPEGSVTVCIECEKGRVVKRYREEPNEREEEERASERSRYVYGEERERACVCEARTMSDYGQSLADQSMDIIWLQHAFQRGAPSRSSSEENFSGELYTLIIYTGFGRLLAGHITRCFTKY